MPQNYKQAKGSNHKKNGLDQRVFFTFDQHCDHKYTDARDKGNGPTYCDYYHESSFRICEETHCPRLHPDQDELLCPNCGARMALLSGAGNGGFCETPEKHCERSGLLVPLVQNSQKVNSTKDMRKWA